MLKYTGVVLIYLAILPASSFAGEDIQILKNMLGTKILDSDKLLEQAKALTFQSYGPGTEVQENICGGIQKEILKNYSLSPQAKLCPDSPPFDSQWVDSIQFFIGHEPSTNIFGVPVEQTLTIEYSYSAYFQAPSQVRVTRQYMLNQSFAVTQFSEVRVEDGFQFSSIVWAVDLDGNMIRKQLGNRKQPNEPYLWRGRVDVALKNGDGHAYINYQNDGKSSMVESREYWSPLDWKWEHFEIFPGDIVGSYKVGDEIMMFPDSSVHLIRISNSEKSCEEGLIGFKDGYATRTFGNQSCKVELDVDTMVWHP